ncbi:MAG TPA: hypothetical protein VKG24_02285 [Pseudolabrys sp.]|nr:hypothetical protein [Pseudolabrys sp.]
MRRGARGQKQIYVAGLILNLTYSKMPPLQWRSLIHDGGAKVKNPIIVALMVAGAIIIATPIVIFGLIRVLWKLGTSLATPRAPVIAEKIRQLAEAAEARISGQKDKQRN